MNRSVVVVAPHYDDEVLGCGGTIARHCLDGDKVHVVFMANRVYNHVYNPDLDAREKRHAEKARRILGYHHAVFLGFPDECLDRHVREMIIALEREVEQHKPVRVYIPFRQDNHQDHRAVFDACRVVFRACAAGDVHEVYMYEVPSSTDQSPALPECVFIPNYFINIAPVLKKKEEAYRSYRTEKRMGQHPRSWSSVKNLAVRRGGECSLHHAEAFMQLRSKWI